jgi:Hint domain
MTGTTISGTHLVTVTLNDAALQNPDTVAIGATISDSGVALVADPGTVWTITNYGLIEGTGADGTGVALDSDETTQTVNGGVISNGSTGTISGTNHGVYLGHGGTVINQGSIYGGTSASNPAAIYLIGGGYVTNMSGGVISAASTGILGLGADTVTVANQGQITAAGNGIFIDTGGSVTNQSGGVINAGSNGIEMLVAPSSTYSGYIFNQAGGTILAGNDGIYVSGGTAVNQGYVSAAGTGMLLAGGSSGTNATGGIIIAAGFGVELQGGSFTNQSGATVSSTGNAAVYGTGGTVVNAGLIDAATYGVTLSAGGTVTNVSGGTIAGIAAGVEISAAAGTVINAASLYATGANSVGVELISGGTVTNQYGGTIDGAEYGLQSSNNATVPNYGQIGVTASIGVGLSSGLVTNAGTATINGSTDGVRITDGGTVENAGTITGGTDAVNLFAGATARLVIDPGAVFNGTVDGGNTVGATAVTTLELASSAATGVFAGLGTQFINFAQVEVDAGAQWTMQSTDTVEAGVTLTNAGTLNGPVSLAAYGVLSNTSIGTVTATSGDAVYGIAGGAATVVNAGMIADTGGGAGIFLAGGGTVANQTGGTISGYTGVYGGAPLTVVNAGSISGYGTYSAGISLQDGGSVTNQSGGVISGYNAVACNNATVTVVNYGTIAAPDHAGVILNAGGSVTNQTGGTITGIVGIYGYGTATVTVMNYGSITSPDGAGIVLLGASSVTNQSGGTIAGYLQGIVDGLAPLTVVNAGSIAASGTSGVGISLEDGGSVTNQSGGTISGYDGIAGANTFVTVVNSGVIFGAPTYQGTGVVLLSGGYVTNQSGGTISGYDGVASASPFVTIVNSGVILGAPTYQGTGVFLPSGGYITNQSGGTISGGAGIYAGAVLTLVNAGTIAGTFGGVGVLAGGTITNQSGATISGTVAVYAKYGAVSLVNAGSILGGTASPLQGGVVLLDGGSVTNQSGGTIVGYDAIYGGKFAALTVENAGSITGTGAAVQFVAGYADLQVVDPTGVFTGTVDGGNTIGATAASTLELAAGAPGTLAGIGTQFIDFVQTTIDAGADWTLTGATFAAGTTLTNAGSLTVSNSTLSDAGLVINNGAIQIDPSTVTLTDVTGSGSVTIDSGSTLNVLGAVAAGETIVFSGGSDLLSVNPTAFSGQINGFTVGDTIDLTGVTDGFSPGIVNGNTLEIQRTGNPPVDLTLDPSVDYAGAVFNVSPTGAITEAPCFLRDTRIRTETGDVMVQDLAVGDRILTQSGQSRPIAWIGTGQVMVSPGRRSAATPVIIRRSALADGVPYHDLRITKGHALFVDGVLVPVEFLVNHRSIHWDDHKRQVEFYHIELETHDVLIANGAPSESYRDDGNRWLFQNANSGWNQPPKPPCAPVLTGGPIVDAIWHRVLERTSLPHNLMLTHDPDLHLNVDGVRIDPATQQGAAHVFRLPDRPQTVRIVSRAAAPAELGLTRDPRRLGVALTRITISKGVRLRIMDAEDPSLVDGFHTFEPELALRWTDGDATLPAALFDGFDGPITLALHLTGSAQYPASAPPHVHIAA